MFKDACLSHAKHLVALNPFESVKVLNAFQTEQEFCNKARSMRRCFHGPVYF